jgi:hypothetical protein
MAKNLNIGKSKDMLECRCQNKYKKEFFIFTQSKNLDL